MSNHLESSASTISGEDANVEKFEISRQKTRSSHLLTTIFLDTFCTNSAPQRLPNGGQMRSTGLFSPGNISHFTKKTFKLGENGSGTRLLGVIQDFDLLRKNCSIQGILFEDLEFLAQRSSIYGSKKVEKDIKWVRPQGIVVDPQFFVKGPSRFDVQQSSVLGDCCFLSALANLTIHPKLFDRIVPQDQSFQKDHYAGIFHFRFWQYGRWVDVVIDDRLPMHKGELLGTHSIESNEFWSSLLEKAYAKLHGSYEALDRGDAGEAMEDFTGRVVELYNHDDTLTNLFSILLKAYKKNSLMAC